MARRKRTQNAWSVDSIRERSTRPPKPKALKRLKRILGNSIFLVAAVIVLGYVVFIVRESYYAKTCDTKICELVQDAKKSILSKTNNKSQAPGGAVRPLASCSELGGQICVAADLCDGNSVQAFEGSCCLGQCRLVRRGMIAGELGIAGVATPSRELFQFQTDQEFDEYLDRTLDLLKESGASYYRLSASEVGGFDFTLAESQEGRYDFSLQDKIVQKFNDEQIPLVAMISPWPRPNVVNANNRQVLNFDLVAYGNYVQQLVERYDGDEVDDMPGLTQSIDYFEVATDPDVYNTLTQGALSPGRYFTALEITSQAIREAHSRAQVIFGSVSFALSDSAEAQQTKIDYINDVLNFDAEDLFDAWKLSYIGNSPEALNSILETVTALANKEIFLDHLWWDETIEDEANQEQDQADVFLGVYKVVRSFGAKLAYYGLQDTPLDILPPFRLRGLYKCQEFAKNSQNIEYCTAALVKKLGITYLELANLPR